MIALYRQHAAGINSHKPAHGVALLATRPAQRRARTLCAQAEPATKGWGERVAGDGKVNPRRSNGTLRNKIRSRVLREETVCWLCGEPVDVKLVHGTPLSPEVDEIIPVSKGGDPYDRKNCRLAHRLCRAIKNAETRT